MSGDTPFMPITHFVCTLSSIHSLLCFFFFVCVCACVCLYVSSARLIVIVVCRSITFDAFTSTRVNDIEIENRWIPKWRKSIETEIAGTQSTHNCTIDLVDYCEWQRTTIRTMGDHMHFVHEAYGTHKHKLIEFN